MVFQILNQPRVGPSLGLVSAYNPSGNYRRSDMATCNLPLPRGKVFTPNTPISLRDPRDGLVHQVEWVPFAVGSGESVRWDDNSFRIARITFPVTLGPGETVDLEANVGQGLNPDFVMHPEVASQWSELAVWFRMGDFPMPILDWQSLPAIGNRTRMRRGRVRHRFGPADYEQLWMDVWVQIGSGLRNTKLWGLIGNSWAHTNPTEPEQLSEHPGWRFPLAELNFIVGPASRFDLHLDFEVEWTHRRVIDAGGDHRITLLDPALLPFNFQSFAHGMTYPLAGSIVFTSEVTGARTQLERDTAAAESQLLPVIAKAQGWVDAGLANPMFGNAVPPVPTWFTSSAEAETAANNYGWSQLGTRVAGEPARFNAGSHTSTDYNPGQTGDQAGFGLLHNTPEYRTKSLIRLQATKRSAYFEWFRPSSHREFDTLALVRQVDHPLCGFWYNMPFTNGGSSRVSDLLGKFGDREEGWGTHLTPKDRQHYAHLCELNQAQLTGDWLLMQMLDEVAERFIFSYRTDHLNQVMRDPEASRAIGRGYMTAAHTYLLTGRQDLRDHLSHHIDILHDEYLAAFGGANVDIVAFWPGYLDARHPPLKWHPSGQFIAAWGDGTAIAGLVAAYEATKNPKALVIAKAMSRTLCLHPLLDCTTPSRQVLACTETWGTPGFRLPVVGDVYIERDINNVEVARGTFVGEVVRIGGRNVHLKDCTAVFPGRFGATLENVTRGSEWNKVIISNPGGFALANVYARKLDGSAWSPQELDDWDPEGLNVPPWNNGLGYPPGQFPNFKNVEWDTGNLIHWAMAAYAYGQVWGAEASNETWRDRAARCVAWFRQSINFRPGGFGWEHAHPMRWAALPGIYP